MSDILLRSLDEHDAPAITNVHLVGFPRSALTRLGRGLVTRYYVWLLAGPHDVVAFGAFDADGGLMGFVVAGRFRRALSGFVNANRRRLVLRLVTHPWLAANPIVRRRAALAWRWAFRRNLPRVTSQPEERPSFGILAIAVRPSFRGLGIGRALMVPAEAAAVQRGCSRLHLSVDRSNERATRFYERLGWSRELVDGAWRGEMSRHLPAQQGTTPSTSS